jgi:hypothetical protein
MLFSQYYRKAKRGSLRWFDPVLIRDTKLFVDPFLVYRSGLRHFTGAHKELISFFDKAFELGALSGADKRHIAYSKLLQMVRFPEVPEVCLGYAASGTSGSGTGGVFSKLIVDAIIESIGKGIVHLDHFELMGLLSEGVGCDRISDITLNILKRRFVAYTRAVCSELGVSTRRCHVKNLSFDMRDLRWEDGFVELPWNPFSNRGLLLVPAQFLRKLPVISPEEFFDYLWDTKNEQLRTDFNYDVKSRVNKHEKIALARSNPGWVREYVGHVESSGTIAPYDAGRDPEGLTKWAREASRYVARAPLKVDAVSHSEFDKALTDMIGRFKRFVELKGGHKLLWDDRMARPRSEEIAQILLLGMVTMYCVPNNIDVTREGTTGVGKVDFKFSRGYREKALLEVKKASNPALEHGITQQLPAYMEAEDTKLGFYLVVYHSDKEKRKAKEAIKLAKSVADAHHYDLRTAVVDARPHTLTASEPAFRLDW